MTEEIVGPVFTVYVYPYGAYEETLQLCDDSKPFALTGLIFGPDRTAIEQAEHLFRNAAGNFCINDKPTGAVVSRQPFGGSRHSGTNDKAGSVRELSKKPWYLLLILPTGAWPSGRPRVCAASNLLHQRLGEPSI